MEEATPPPPYGDYYREIYARGISGTTPELPVAWSALERAAEATLDERAAGYVFGSAGSEDTARANLEAFRRWRIVPRMLRDVSARDLRTEILGIPIPAPLALCPVGVQHIVHPGGEPATARGAVALGVPMIASTVSAHPMEAIAEALGDTPGMFQLYWPNEPELAASLVGRAEAAGYRAIVVTVDNAFPGWKPRDLQHAWLPFLQGEGLANFFTDPVFCEPLERSPTEDQGAAIGRFLGVFANPALTWDDLAWLRDTTELPILLKGILHPDDAREARERGIDGVVVSNHGGRQVDGAIASLDALPAIAGAVGDELAVLFDSGIRSGADVVKALALGADAVCIGRPFLWGLALGGAEGVETVLRRILAELDLTLALSGYTSAAEIDPSALLREGAIE